MKKKKTTKRRLVFESQGGYKIVRANWLTNLLFAPMFSGYRYYLLAPNKILPIVGSHWLWYIYSCLDELDEEFDSPYCITKS